MNQEIPEEFKNKDREELYMDIIMVIQLYQQTKDRSR